MVLRKRRTVTQKEKFRLPSLPAVKPKTAVYGVIGAALFIVLLVMVFSEDEPIVEEVIATPAVVEVLNGCGVSGIAGRMTDFLKSNTIEVFNTGDADNSSYPETILIGRDSRFDHAAEISALTGIKNRTYDYESESLVNVTIILGKDYQNFQPFIK